MLFIALLGGMLAFLASLALLEYFGRQKDEVTRKVRRYADAPAPAYAGRPGHFAVLMSFIRYLGRQLRDVPQTKALDFAMQQAGWPLLGGEFLAITAVVSLSVGLLGFMLTLRLAYGVLVALAAGLVCWLYLKRRIVRRRQAFNNQLGDALAMLANAMRSGFSLTQSMDLVAKEMRPPLSEEFAKTLAEIRLGSDLEPALLNQGRRVASNDQDLVITAVLIQRQVGGNLAQILDSIAATINERLRMKREIKTLTAQGRLSAYVLAALPAAVALFASVVNPGYLRVFIDEPLGRLTLVATVVWQLIGFLVIRKIIDIDI